MRGSVTVSKLFPPASEAKTETAFAPLAFLEDEDDDAEPSAKNEAEAAAEEEEAEEELEEEAALSGATEGGADHQMYSPSASGICSILSTAQPNDAHMGQL